jgi:hypothetical protein
MKSFEQFLKEEISIKGNKGVPSEKITDIESKAEKLREEIDILLKVEWWKYSNKIINDLLPALNSNNFKLFFNKIKSIRKLK